VADPFRETRDALVTALLRLTRAQVDWQNRLDVQAELLRAGAAVADVMDLLDLAEKVARQLPPETPRG
jgi:hypothetical protein